MTTVHNVSSGHTTYSYTPRREQDTAQAEKKTLHVRSMLSFELLHPSVAAEAFAATVSEAGAPDVVSAVRCRACDRVRCRL